MDIQKYTRKLNIKKEMLNKTPMGEKGRAITPRRVVHSQLRNKSLFNPSVHNNEHIEVFNKMVLQDLVKLKV